MSLPILIVGIVLCLLGIIMPNITTINGTIGYKSVRSMKNQRNWNFAQRYAGRFMLYAGIASLAICLVNYLMGENQQVNENYYFLCLTVFCAVMIYKTETELKKFDQKN